MLKKTILLLFLLLVPFKIVLATDLMAKEKSPETSLEPLEIEGDSLETMLDRKMKAKGNAFLKKGSKIIKSEIIEYDEVSEKLSTFGDTHIDLENMSLTGSSLSYKLNDDTGSLTNATFKINRKSESQNKLYFNRGMPTIKKSYEYRGEAETIFFEGESKKRLENSKITTCEINSNDWYLKSNSAEINTKSDKVTGHNSTIEFKGVPLMYSPYINFSLNNERKSGFLSPSFGSTTKSGFEFTIPYYFNISPEQDLTLKSRYLGNRGEQIIAEHRYLGEEFSGTNQIEYLNRDESNSQSNRYSLHLTNKYFLAKNWLLSYDFNKASDDKYFTDMSSVIQMTSRINLPQRLSIGYSGDILKFNALMEKYQTLSPSSSKSPYQRLPQINLLAAKEYETFKVYLNSQLSYFDRDSKFNFTNNSEIKNDSSATGARLIFSPGLEVNLIKNYGYIKPRVSINYRSYNLKNSMVSNKDIYTPIASIDSGTTFDKKINFMNENYTNTLEPRLFYVYVPYRDQSSLPLFDTSLADLNMQTLFSENQYNGQDRINNANQLTASVTSKLIDSNGDERASLVLAQRYYLSDRRTIGALNKNIKDDSDIFAGLSLRLPSSLNLDSIWQYNPSTSKILRNTLTAKYNPQPGKLVNIAYRMVNDISDSSLNLKNINFSGQWPLGNNFYSIGRLNYDLKSSKTVEMLAGVEYDGGCWVARGVFDKLSLPSSQTDNYTFFMQLELNGLGNIGTDANKLSAFLNRNIPGAQLVNEIPNSN